MATETTRRVVWSELLRGSGLWAGLGVIAVGAALLYIHIWYVHWVGIQAWVGRWGPLAASIRTILAVLIPLVVGAAAWQGGRDRRRRIDDQLASTPRPVWQRALGSWAAITVGAVGGLLLVWLSAVVFVAPVATYSGGGWWWTLAIAFLSVASAAAVGLAAGRLIPFRFVVPVAALLAYFYMEILTNPGIPESLIWLSPANLTMSPMHPTFHLESSLHFQQALWIGGVGATALILAGARRKWLAIIPAIVAAIGVSVLLAGPGWERWRADPAAQELVCSGTVPDVCLVRANAFLIDEVVPVVLEHMTVWDGVEGIPDRLIDSSWGYLDIQDTVPLPSGAVELYWGPDPRLLAGTLVSRPACDLLDEESLDFESPDPWAATPISREEAGIVAYGWAVKDPTAGSAVFDHEGNPVDPVVNPDIERLFQLPDSEQKAWMSRYLAAAQTCDDETFTVLLSELR